MIYFHLAFFLNASLILVNPPPSYLLHLPCLRFSSSCILLFTFSLSVSFPHSLKSLPPPFSSAPFYPLALRGTAELNTENAKVSKLDYTSNKENVVFVLLGLGYLPQSVGFFFLVMFIHHIFYNFCTINSVTSMYHVIVIHSSIRGHLYQFFFSVLN